MIRICQDSVRPQTPPSFGASAEAGSHSQEVKLVQEFDESRARIYTNAAERTNRIGAVLALPRGIVPEVTVISYKFFKLFATNFDRSFGLAFKSAGVAFGIYSAMVLTGLHTTPVVRALLAWIGKLL